MLGDVILDLGQNAVFRFQHQHFGAEVVPDLSHFNADDAAADDAQPTRRRRQGPDAVGSQHTAAGHRLARAGDRRHEWRRAGGNHRRAEGQCRFRAIRVDDLQCMRVDERGKAVASFDLDALVGLCGEFAACLQNAFAVRFQRRPIQAGRLRTDHALVRVVGAVADHVGGVPPGLGRNAAAPEAFAAGQGRVVDHDHLDAMIGEIARAILAAGAAADDRDLGIPITGGDRAGGFDLVCHAMLLGLKVVDDHPRLVGQAIDAAYSEY